MPHPWIFESSERIRLGPLLLRDVRRLGRAFHGETGQKPVQPLRQPPASGAEQVQEGWYEHQAQDQYVQEHGAARPTPHSARQTRVPPRRRNRRRCDRRQPWAGTAPRSLKTPEKAPRWPSNQRGQPMYCDRSRQAAQISCVQALTPSPAASPASARPGSPARRRSSTRPPPSRQGTTQPPWPPSGARRCVRRTPITCAASSTAACSSLRESNSISGSTSQRGSEP